MTTATFNRDGMAARYAKKHLKTDPGIREVYYLPTNSPEREIRFIEVNEMIADRESDPLEPIDFGVNSGDEDAHSLFILDVTPDQWDRIRLGELKLTSGWSFEQAKPIV